jgi:hypothetical protein
VIGQTAILGLDRSPNQNLAQNVLLGMTSSQFISLKTDISVREKQTRENLENKAKDS